MPSVFNFLYFDTRSLRTLGEPKNLISGSSGCSESPKISFSASPDARRAQKSHLLPLRMLGEPKNLIYCPSGRSVSPKISFIAPPDARGAQKSHLLPLRTLGEPKNLISGPSGCSVGLEIPSTGFFIKKGR